MRQVICGLAALLVLGALGCSESTDWISDESVALDEEYGKPVLGETQDVGKGDSMTGGKLVPTSVDNSDTQVWAAVNDWEDRDTAAAREEGISWSADSGLSWEEKYQVWVRDMSPIEATEGYSSYTTFALKTPHGKELPAPRLECAETALFLRATFASWYGLPFIVSAWDQGPVYFGHFGIRTRDGKYANSPRFKKSYQDYSGLSVAEYSAEWPRDSKLRARKLSSSKDDKNGFLCEDCYAGAYFDEIFLNKRTGHFLVWLLTYTGSMHLASSDNAFHLQPKAVKEGDVLLERWRKKGIGHTLIVKKVDPLEGGRLSAELASGSMPRRQPRWESAASSKSTFLNTYCGGPGENSDGDEYARLGGGLKRFRQPQVKNGYWYLVVPESSQDYWIADSDVEGIAGRLEEFDQLLGSLSPEEKTVVLLQKIEEKREHLRHYPASCAARVEREKAFKELYDLQHQHYNRSVTQVDEEYRIFEDYVFAELDYNVSKTCCWNSSTAGMYEIIMDYNYALLEESEECVEPVVFKAQDGGYALFQQYAESIDRGEEWVAWSEDETCPQADVVNDTETEHQWTPLCDILDAVLDGGDAGSPCDDQFTGNYSSESAAELTVGTYEDLAVCSGDGDWYVLMTDGASWVIEAAFGNEADIDIELFDSEMESVDRSAGTGPTESVKIPGTAGTWYLHVKLYSGPASASYTLSIGD